MRKDGSEALYPASYMCDLFSPSVPQHYRSEPTICFPFFLKMMGFFSVHFFCLSEFIPMSKEEVICCFYPSWVGIL